MLTCKAFYFVVSEYVVTVGRQFIVKTSSFLAFLSANSSLVSSKSISHSLSCFTQRILSQTAALVTVLNEAHFWFFSALKIISHQNSLWPSNIRAILKLFPRLEKQPGFFMLDYYLVQLLVVETFFFRTRRLTYKWKVISSSTRFRSTSSGYSCSIP